MAGNGMELITGDRWGALCSNRTTFVRGLLTRALSIQKIPQVFGFQGETRSLISGFLTLVMIFNCKVYRTDICLRVASVMSPSLVEETQGVPLEGHFAPFLRRRNADTPLIGSNRHNSPRVSVSSGIAQNEDGGTKVENAKNSGNPLPPC